MKCVACKGRGHHDSGLFMEPCVICGGSGEVDSDNPPYEPVKARTNFMKITESPEALAEFMDKLSNACITCGEKGPEFYNDDCPFGDFGNCADHYTMLMWLNQESKE